MMPESREQSPGEDYFNDLSQQPKTDAERRGSQEENGQVPKPKRVACILCRKRKLKCDGSKPSCGTCTRLQHDCSYDEVRKKSGPKRGYVKALEARLAQVETLLKTQDEQPSNGTTNETSNGIAQAQQSSGMVPEFNNIGMVGSNMNMMPHIQQTVSQQDLPLQPQHALKARGAAGANGEANGISEEPFPWEMIGLGLDEPLPNQDVVNELNQIYFEKVHPSLPMVHRPRYHAAMNLAPHMRPPVCLRYAMWCNAASVSDKYDSLQEHFYQRARKYIQQDEMKGHGESMITVAHCQTWALLATHEFRLMYFPRAWLSAGRASRMALMMGLHRLDGSGLDVKQCLPPPKDWTEREERRRTFWMCFCVDRYSSIGTGWPMMIEEGDIMTSLPGEEDSFEFSKPSKTINLSDALDPNGPPQLSSAAGVILMASLFGRNLTHLHRPGPNDQDDDLNGEFWRRHRNMDNILLNTTLALPDVLRLPSGLNSPNTVFLNMNIHTSTICLHQAAIFKADKNRMPARISAESKVRCITAAAEIASIMRQISHLDLSTMNPFISFCLYVAARVFVQYLKSRPNDGQVKASLQFLLSAMHAIKRKNPLTESFLAQLDVDLEGAGLDDANSLRAQMQKSRSPQPNRSPGCPQDHLGMSSLTSDVPTYGNQGLAAYTQPNQSMADIGVGGGLAVTGAETYPGAGAYNLNLPTRQRTPGSVGTYRSPSSFEPQMDTSPDGSNNDQQTPASSTQHNQSSHTSNTGYSPPNHLESGNEGTPMNPAQLAAMFNGTDPAFTTDFNMHSFPPSALADQGQGFVLPTNWSGDVGITRPTGTTSGVNTNGMLAGFQGNGLGDMMPGMTDADWNSVMESFTGWENGMEHLNVPEVIGRRR